jgi:hypothetical protein
VLPLGAVAGSKGAFAATGLRLAFQVRMTTPNEPRPFDREPEAPGGARRPSDRRADKGRLKAGFWAIVIGFLVLGIAVIALDLTRPAEKDEGIRNADEQDAGVIDPRPSRPE